MVAFSSIRKLLFDSSHHIGADAVMGDLTGRVREVGWWQCCMRDLRVTGVPENPDTRQQRGSESFGDLHNSTYDANRAANPVGLIFIFETPTFVAKRAGAIGCDHGTPIRRPAAIFPNHSNGVVATNDGSESLGAFVNHSAPSGNGPDRHAYDRKSL